jgi:hypothetical protein
VEANSVRADCGSEFIREDGIQAIEVALNVLASSRMNSLPQNSLRRIRVNSSRSLEFGLFAGQVLQEK